MWLGHGGKVGQDKILDFSSNINPLGITAKIRDIIIQQIKFINRYPDPECKSARQNLGDYLKISRDNILIGNGSCEFIYLIPSALKCSSVFTYQPAFSEYSVAGQLCGVKNISLWADEKDGFAMDVEKIIKCAPKVNLIILCNPNNPTGHLLKKEGLLDLLKACQKNKTYLLIDEVFMEFVQAEEKYSLLKEAAKQKYLLVLRSLTKFFSLPGLRVGYLVADKEVLEKIKLFQPTWSVNTLAQGIISNRLFDGNFIKRTKAYVRKEKEFLFNRLQQIQGIEPFYPLANFIFCKITHERFNAYALSKCLIKSGILIRNCSNFQGLDSRFFRIAVRKRKENTYLIGCLKKILK